MKFRSLSFIALFALLASLALSTHADEKHAPASYWLSLGYRLVAHSRVRRAEIPSWAAHSLLWPVPFQDAAHSLGNSTAEFQDYDDGEGPYYHGGCDLRVQPQQTVVAPVSGKLEAGHYGYTNNPDGSSAKYWIPWPGDGDEDYFELAVVTDDGYRFEMHHIDADALPDSTVAILQAGGRVQAGQLIGQTILWPDGVYNHTHLNVMTPSGVQLNPEYYFPLIPDHAAPVIQAAMAVMQDGSVLNFDTGRFSQAPAFFAVAVNDQQDGDIYVHPPALAGVEFQSGQKFIWDFRERLWGPNGKFPPIWDFFVKQITDARGNEYETSGGYGTGLSVIRIPVPQRALGPFTLEVADEAGNFTKLSGVIGTRASGERY